MGSSISRSKAILAAALTAMITTGSRSFALTGNNWNGTVGNYNTAGNWSQGNVPTSGDQADIFSGTATLSANSPTAGGILAGKVISAPTLATNGFRLTSSGLIQIDNGAFMHIGAANGPASVQAANFSITAGSTVDMTSSAAILNASNSLTLDSSTFEVGGTVNVTNTFTNNNGTLQAKFNTTINAATFTMTGTSADNGIIDANGLSMTINAPTFNMHDPDTQIDAFGTNSNLTLNGQPDLTPGNVGSDVTIGNNSQLNLPGGNVWLFGYYQKSGANFIQNGSVTLAGGSTLATAARINEYAAYYTTVNVTGYANMPGGGEFDGDSSTTVSANSFLYVNSPYFRGIALSNDISISGAGTVNWSGNTVIGFSNAGVPFTEVSVANGTLFNWEGTSGANATLDIQNGELDVFATSIQPRLIKIGMFSITVNGYDGNMTIEANSTLNVAGNSWDLFGSMTLGPGALVEGQTIFVNGTSLAPGTYSINPTFTGTTFPSIAAPVVLQANSTIFLGTNGGLHMDGNTTYAGGSVGSAPFVEGTSPYGIFIQNGNATVTGNTTIFCNTFDMDGSANTATWSINANVTLTQQAWYLDPTDTTNNPFHSTINLNGGTLDMETHSGKWTLAGGTLNMGGNEAIVQHDKLVLGLGSTIGTVNVANGTVGFISGGLESAATGVAGGNVINNNGNLVVDSVFTLDANSVLSKTGTFALEIEVGTPVMGVGSVFNISNGPVQFFFGIPGAPNVTINLQNSVSGFFDVSHLNTLHIEAGGVAVISSGGDHSMQVTNLIIDGGASPTGGFSITDNKVVTQVTPATKATALATLRAQVVWGETHLLTGIFDDDLPANYGIAVIDNAILGRATFGGIPSNSNSILISQELLGDANVDGHVDLSDLSTILNNFGAVTGEWTSGNFDGAATIDLTDLSDVLNNFGASNANAFQVAAAAPEPMTMALLGVAGLMLLRRRKC